MFNIHHKPSCESEKNILRQLIVKQTIAAHKQSAVISCGSCQKIINLARLYKCLYCGVWFCRRCAKKHFGGLEV